MKRERRPVLNTTGAIGKQWRAKIPGTAIVIFSVAGSYALSLAIAVLFSQGSASLPTQVAKSERKGSAKLVADTVSDLESAAWRLYVKRLLEVDQDWRGPIEAARTSGGYVVSLGNGKTAELAAMRQVIEAIEFRMTLGGLSDSQSLTWVSKDLVGQSAMRMVADLPELIARAAEADAAVLRESTRRSVGTAVGTETSKKVVSKPTSKKRKP